MNINSVLSSAWVQIKAYLSNNYQTKGSYASINSQGNGWIRYNDGLQICMGGGNNNSSNGVGLTKVTYAKSFSSTPKVITEMQHPTNNYYGCHSASVTTSNFILYCYLRDGSMTTDGFCFSYITIGYWK